MKKLTLIILTIFTLGFIIPKKNTIFIGTIVSDEQTKNDIAGLIIDFRIDTLVIAQSIVERDGAFKISASADKEFDVYYRGIGIGENYALTIKSTEKDTIKFTIEIPRKYNKKKGKIVCPKCSEQDQTIPIRYGLGTEIVYRQVDKKGDTTYISYDKNNYYEGGCVHSEISPKYFCKRDKLKF
jgi:hypothetical protein